MSGCAYDQRHSARSPQLLSVDLGRVSTSAIQAGKKATHDKSDGVRERIPDFLGQALPDGGEGGVVEPLARLVVPDDLESYRVCVPSRLCSERG